MDENEENIPNGKTELEKQVINDILDGFIPLEAAEALVYFLENARDFRTDPDRYRGYFLQVPDWAYLFAKNVDQGPRDDTRAATLSDPYTAYWYAEEVDKCPRDDTREAACKQGSTAFLYARDVDKGPHAYTYGTLLDDESTWVYFYEAEIGIPFDALQLGEEE